jgi:hypothetical protein
MTSWFNTGSSAKGPSKLALSRLTKIRNPPNTSTFLKCVIRGVYVLSKSLKVGGIPKIKGLEWGGSECVPSYNLPILKHETNIVMNLNIHRSQNIEEGRVWWENMGWNPNGECTMISTVESWKQQKFNSWWWMMASFVSFLFLYCFVPL